MNRLKIVKDAVEYTVPVDFALKDDNVDVRQTIKDKVYSHGGIDTSDGKIKQKTLTLKGILYGATRAAYLTIVQEFREKVYQENYQLYFGEPATYNYFYNIRKLFKIKNKYIEGQDYFASEVEATLLLTDPFLYYKTKESVDTTIDASPKTFTVTNDGNVNAYPVITITADMAVSTLKLQNNTDIPSGETEGLKFDYIDNHFVSGNDLIIDCQEGTVERESNTSIRYFSGAFLKLIPGSNSITYTGDTNTGTKVKFEFYKRYL